jgi:glycosyltransferase involved in cell wall biosynthesis
MSVPLSFAATNPCHVYDMALALHERGRLGAFLCGYPRWRLRAPDGFPHVPVGWRTVAVYAWRRLPPSLRPHEQRLFRWQDVDFDRKAARHLPASGVIHGIPGQCRELFAAARARGMTTVMNHASGPLEQQARLVEPEYARAGVPFSRGQLYPDWWLERIQEEMIWTDYHCVASSVVKDQLVADGLAADDIVVVPYGAHPSVFPKRSTPPPATPRILFAGQLTLRKGLHYLLRALKEAAKADWMLDCYGPLSDETTADFERFTGPAQVRRHGPLPQRQLAAAMARSTVLVLPSAEEAFGLVVAQALQVGIPCIVSDRVGAKDLIVDGENGSIVPFGDVPALAAALTSWVEQPKTIPECFDWTKPAETLLAVTDERRT